MTLDADDVERAKQWLAAPRETWADPAPRRAFETAFAEMNDSRAAFAFTSARESLSAVIEALGLEPGDEVVMPGYTCVVVPNAFRFAGVTVRYADIELDTYGPSLESVRERTTERTRALLIHHLYGLVCRDYEALVAFAREQGIPVIEDCAQATGAQFEGRGVGNLGDVAVFSCEQTKGFTTINGGLAVTDRFDIADRLSVVQNAAPEPDVAWTEHILNHLLLRYHVAKRPHGSLAADWTQAQYSKYQLAPMTPEETQGVRPEAYGRRMPAPLAAIGLGQLAKLDAYNQRRREAAAGWDRWARERGYEVPHVLENSVPSFLRYPLLVDPARKDDLTWARRELGFQPGVWFVSNLHPVTDRRPAESVPSADRAVACCINLPTLR